MTSRLTRATMPRLYAILDAGAVAAAGLALLEVAVELREAGVRLLQYRDKLSGAATVLDNARRIRELFAGTGALLILNDFADLCVQADWDGVHVGQADVSVTAARALVGQDRLIGVSTHTSEQLRLADRTDADYLAIGPVFATVTKPDAAEPAGLEGVVAARALTQRPLVAIGGITARRAAAVLDAGADAVAMIGALLTPDGLADGLADGLGDGLGTTVQERVRGLIRGCAARPAR